MTARWLGAAVPGLLARLDGLDQMATALGSKPAVATSYESWSWKRTFATIVPQVDALRAWGAVPQITWEPWDPALGVNQPKYTLARIVAGDFDTYIKSWATDVKTYGYPLRLRFAHEMNGTWYPWCEGVNGNQPYDYVKAWWHVRGIFDAVGVPNVSWIWCPQAPYPGLAPMARMYPGDGGVDEVALDGYNWALNGQPWNSFYGVFKQGVAEVAMFSTRPVSIGETGCPEVGADKAAWIRGMWAQLAAWPQVRGVLWFNYAKEADWRVDSSPASLAAFKAGLPAYLAG